MNPNIPPDDLKTYSSAEARTEWNGARDAKRRMILARVGKRQSLLAKKNWELFSAPERQLVLKALNEDFFSPMWYINKRGQKIMLAGEAPPEKSAEEIAVEEAGERWASTEAHQRAMALYECNVGADAEQGKYCQWNTLAPALRVRLAEYFARVPVPVQVNRLAPSLGKDPRQIDLF